MATICADATKLTASLIDETIQAVGLRPQAWTRWLISALAGAPIGRFGKLLAELDRNVAQQGAQYAAQTILERLGMPAQMQHLAPLPQGPLLVVANHPGTVDSAALIASIDRQDLNALVTDRPTFRLLTASTKHYVFVPRPPDARGRMGALREATRRLQRGGCLLAFPDGIISPDPETVPGAYEDLGHWAGSVDLMLRQTPEAHVVTSILSGVLAPRWWRHPLARLRRGRMERQRVAEFLQIISQMARGRPLGLTPHVTLGPPVSVSDLAAESGSPKRLMPAVITLARQTYRQHIAWLAKSHVPLADPHDRSFVSSAPQG